MNRRTPALAPTIFLLALCACLLSLPRPAYAASMVDLSVDGAKSYPNSLADLQKALKAAGGKNKTVVIDFNQDVYGDPLELPKKTTITINLNGHTINRNLTSPDSSGHAMLVESNSRVTINGGTTTAQKQVKAWNPNGTTTWRTLTVSGLITGGYSTNKSGGIYLESGARLTLNNVTIAGCRAEQKGGTDGYGGGIWAGGSDVTVALNNSNVSYNYAYNDGGGIASTSKLFNLFMSNSRVANNFARRDGGGIALKASKATVTGDANTTVANNSCGDEYGGGVYVNETSVSVSGFTVEHNQAKYGGGVATRNHSITLSLLNIHDNTAKYGGGVYIGDFTNVASTATDSMGGCTITKNSTTEDRTWGRGAGVYVVGSGRGWLVKSFSLEIGGKTIIKDNGSGSGNLIMGSTGVHPNFTLTGDSDVYMGYETITEDAVQVTHDRLKGPNCIRYLKAENLGYHFTYHPSGSKRKIFYVKNGKDDAEKYGTTYGERQTVDRIASAAAAPRTDGKTYKGYPVTRGYVRFPSGVEEEVDLATPFFYSDGYFFDDPEVYNPHLATASMCMAMSGFYLNSGNKNQADGYINKHASARQFMADIGCDDQSTYVNDFNVQKPGIDTIGVTISHKELKHEDGTGSDRYLIPVAIRGSNYEAEWTSNVTLNKATDVPGGEAAGFASAANKVYKEIRSYMQRHNIPAYKARFWVAGYSRAGATTNLVCKRLIDNLSAGQAKVFGYPMEAPQGGANATGIDDRNYFSIHNVINQADLVPLVAPSAMGFKRYGVDHYIPGTNASTPELVENDAVTRAGVGGPNRRYLYADNIPIYSNDSNYGNEGAIAQLKAIDPNIVFDDYFATCSMDFVPSPSIFEKPTGKTVVYEEQFLRDFLNELQVAAISNRDSYASDLEPTFRTVMGMLFGMEPSRTKAFMDRASTTMNRFDMLFASWDEHSMFRIWYSLIGDWNKSSAAKKKEYTDYIYKKLKETDALDVLTKEERAKFDAAWPKLLDFIMRVLDRDYNTKSYDTAKMMMLGTFGYNTSRIMANHYPEITLAWLRTYDDFYTNERTATAIQNAPSVSTPSASVGKTNLKGGGQVNEIPSGKQTVTLDVTNATGEAIYYKMSGAKTSANTCKNGYDIYRGGIDLGSVAKDDTYTITAYAISYGTKSPEATYQISVTGALHKVKVYNEYNARLNRKSETYEWSEGTQQEVEAKETAERQLDSWRVWDEKGRDVTSQVLGDQQMRKKTATFTMPAGGQYGLSQDYKLTFSASFKWKTREYPKHTFTVKVGSSTETFQAAENQTFKYDATSKIPAGKHFKEWKVTDQAGADVTRFMRPGYRNSRTEDFVWGSKSKPNLYCEVTGNNQTVSQTNEPRAYTFAQGYNLTFEAVLEDVATVDAIKIRGVGEAASGANKATIEYYAGSNKVHELRQYAIWKSSQSTARNEDATVTTTTTYKAMLNCPVVPGKPFVADDEAMKVEAEVGGVLNKEGYKVEWSRQGDGAMQVTITKVETRTTGMPTFAYSITANACDKNDADRNVLSEGGQELTSTQTLNADADGVLWFVNGPDVRGGRFCGYEAATDSGLEKTNANDPYDNTFKVVDKTKPLTVNMLYVPEISQIEVAKFPQPVTGEPLASKDSEGIDLTCVVDEGSAFAGAFKTQVTSLDWQPTPGADQKAAGDTAYVAELELACIDEDDGPYECAFALGGVSVSTGSEHPAFESASFDSATGKLCLYLNKTERDTKHKVTVVDCQKDDTAEDAKAKTYSWNEGEAKSVTAKSYDVFAFSGWNVTDGTHDAKEAMGLTDDDLKQQTLAFVMPNKGGTLGDGYELHLEASYVPKASGLRAIIAEPTGTALADTAQIKWRATEESEQRTVTVPVAWGASVQSGGDQTDLCTYTATMRLDAAAAAEFTPGDLTVAAGRSDAEDYANVTTAYSRNADGSMTVSVTFAPIQTAANKEDVTIEAYDANAGSKLASVSDTTLTVSWDMDDNGAFELLPPAMDGAAFVGWEVPDNSKVERIGTTGSRFRLKDAVAGDPCNVRALYVPEVTSVTIAGVAAPVAGQQLTELSNNNVTATLGFSDATKTLFGENALPGGADATSRIRVANLAWTPEAAGNEADFETAYTAAAKVVARRVKMKGGQEVEDGVWRFVYARGASVRADGASTTRLNAAADTAVLHFPQTGRDKYHQVNIARSTYNTNGEEYVTSWHEGNTYVVTARGIDDKLFFGWTIVDGSGADVATGLGLSADDLKSETIRVTMPTYVEGGAFAKDYRLAIAANYADKLNAITATVPQPALDAEQLPTKATLTWGEGQDQTAEVDLWWDCESEVTEGEGKTVTESYTAAMQLDAQRGQAFARAVTVTGATTSVDGPQVRENGATWTWNPDGSATITVAFDPIVTHVEARRVVVQACDVNTSEQAKVAGTEDEELTLPVDGENTFAAYAPEVAGAEFVDWVVPDKVAKVNAPQPDSQHGADALEDGRAVGFFQFEGDAPAGATYTIKALYKPVVDVVQTVFAAPKAGQAMATKDDATANFTLQNDGFSPVTVAVGALAWDPAAEAGGTAAYGRKYDATVTLAPAEGKQFAYADDLLPDYEVAGEGDEDDAAMVEYAVEDPAHTMYVSFYQTETPGLQRIVDSYPIVATNDKNSAAVLKLLLPTQVDIEVVGNATKKANVTWDDPVCDEDGGKAYESFWYAEGTITLPDGVTLPDDASPDALRVCVPIYVMASDTLNLLDVEQPADLTDVDPNSDIAQQLPATTTLTMEDGVQEDVAVEWGEPTLVEDGEDMSESVWTVTGAVKTPLPSWIVNPEGAGHVDLTLALNAYVNPPDRQREPADPPYATLDDGIFDLSQVIYLDAHNPNARIYYTTDTGAGLADFEEYVPGTPIYLDRTTVDEDSLMAIQAYATEEGRDPSEVVSYLYMLDEAIDVPEGMELVYNGEEQLGVWSGDDYALMGPSSGSRIDEYGDAVATSAGTYTVRAHIADGLQWQLGEPDEEGNAETTTDDQTVTFKILPASITECSVDGIAAQTYAKGGARPKPTVRLNGHELVEGRDYTLSYEDNLGIGKARAIVTGKGNFKDSLTVEFDIVGGDTLPVTYAGHAQKKGDVAASGNGKTLGTTGQGLRLEALSATVEGGSIEYRSHLQKTGWEPSWSKDGALCGTTGESRRMEAVQMRLSDRLTEAGYHVWYRVHSQTYGWLGWASDGAPAGTSGMSKRLEAVQIVVLHGDARPKGYDAAKPAFYSHVTVNAHVQRDGWLGYAPAGVFGTTGESKRLEAMWAKVGLPYAGGVEYRTHVQRIGWQDWVADGTIAGTTRQAKRIEAIRMRLTGENAKHLSVWYRAHVQGIGWTKWVHDGALAGTTGRGLRTEAVEVVVLTKGAVPNK